LAQKAKVELQKKARRDDVLRKKKGKVERILRSKGEDASKFTVAELKLLCGYKKRKGDQSIANIKGPTARAQLLRLWSLWKDRESPDVSDTEVADDDNGDNDNVIVMDDEMVGAV
jgi:hypothetical protein